MNIVGRLGNALVLVLATAAIASADEVPDGIRMDRLWPQVPADHAVSLEDQITDHLTDLGNRAGANIDRLSHDLMGLRIDGRANRARIRLGGGNPHYLKLVFDSDWHFADGKARVQARLQLGLAGHVMEVQLPDLEVIPDSVHGEKLVQVNVPLLERRF